MRGLFGLCFVQNKYSFCWISGCRELLIAESDGECLCVWAFDLTYNSYNLHPETKI